MNEEFLNHIYNTLYKDKTDYNTFKNDFIGNEEFITHTFNQLGYAKKGITLDAFKADLGLNQVSADNIPSSFQDPTRSKKDKGYRNNNPLNLKYRGKNEFRVFNNLEEGYIAAAQDLGIKLSGKSPALNNNLKKQGKSWGDATLKDLIYTWAPPSDNSPESLATYLQVVGEELGVDPTTIHPSQVDPKQLAIAMSKMESPNSYNTLKQFQAQSAVQPAETSQASTEPLLTKLLENDAIKLANKKAAEKQKEFAGSPLKKIAYNWNRKGIISDLLDGNGFGVDTANKQEIEQAKLEVLQSGKYGDFNNSDELAAVLNPNYKEDVLKTAKAAENIQKNLEADFDLDAGLFDTNPFGDNRGYRRDGKTGKKQADIIPNFWVGDNAGQYWMNTDKLLTLTEHPLITKNPKKYTYREQKELNQHLRDIQSDLTKPQQVARTAATGNINNYLEYAKGRLKNLETELTTKYGNLEKLSERAQVEIQKDPAYQSYIKTAKSYEEEYKNFENKSAEFKLAEVNDYLEKAFNKKEDQNYKKNYTKLGILEKSLQNITSFAKDALTAASNMPGDIAVLAGTGVDAKLGTDIATTRSIASAYNANKISTTAIKEGAVPLRVKLDTEDEIYAIYNDKNEIERFTDGNYFTITDDKNSETFKNLLVEEQKSKNSGKPTWGFNNDAFLHGIREPMIDMVPLILGGGAAQTLLSKGASLAGKTSRLGNALAKTANSDKFLTFAGSFAGFSGKMMDGAIKEGGLVDAGDIFSASTAKIGLEGVIESFNPLGGKLFTDKLFSSLSKQQVKQLSKIVSEQGVFKALPIISQQFSKEILENGLGEMMEEIIATVAEPTVVNTILNNTIGTAYDESFSLKDVAESALVGMASGFAMGGILEGGPTATSALRDPSSVIQESLRASLQNKTLFDTIIEQQKASELQNTSEQDVEKVTAKYDKIAKVMNSAATYSEKVFKEHPDTGHVPSSGIQTLYSNIAFSKATKENKKYDLEEDINNNSKSIEQDTKKLRQLDLFIGNSLDFFTSIENVNTSSKIMSDIELADNYSSVYNEFKNIISSVAKTKNSDQQKIALIEAKLKSKLVELKNKTENKVNDEIVTKAEEDLKVETAKAKEEEKVIKAEEAIQNGTATAEQLESRTKAQVQRVQDNFDLFIEQDDKGLYKVKDQTGLEGLIAENPLAQDVIQEKLEKLNITNFKTEVARVKTEISKVPTSKNTTVEDAIGTLSPEARDIFERSVTDDFIKAGFLDKMLNEVDPLDIQTIQQLNAVAEVFTSDITPDSFDIKLSIPAFREFVEERRQQKPQPVEYVKPVEKTEPKPVEVIESVLQDNTKQIIIYNNNSYTVEIKNGEGVITNNKTGKIISNTSPVGKKILDLVNWDSLSVEQPVVESTPTTTTDIDAKKADIERRRQEELNPITTEIEKVEKEIDEIEKNYKTQGAYAFSASSNSGKWNSANNELLNLVQDNRKAFAIYKFLIGDMETFKEIVDFLNERGIEIPYTDRMKRADETMTVEERKSAIDSYNDSVDSKVKDKAQVEKDILSENNLQDETDYTPQELIEKYPLTGVQKVIWNLIEDVVNKLGIKVKFSSSRITEGFDGSNNPLNGEILIRPSTLKSGRFGEVLVHEIVHALTTKIISRVNSGVTTGLTQKQINAVNGLMKLFKAVEADNNLENKYPVKDVFEFIAHLTNDTFVKELESKDKSFLQKVVDFIADILGITNANELTKQYLKDIISDGTFLQEQGITIVASDYSSNLQGNKENSKLQELKNKLKELKQQVSKINAKYDAELAELEKIKSTEVIPNIDAKKADIEGRSGLNGVEEIIFSNPNFRLEGFEIDGNYWNVVTSTDRAKVLVNINGVIVPFYLTTGQAGKGLVPGWYPFFGIGKDGWLNKTDKSDMETYYERYWGKETADIVKSISEELNSFYGTNPSTFKNDGDPNATSRPLTTLADKVEDYINSKLNYTPAINNADARKTLRSNVEQLGREINAKYDAELKALEQTVQTQETKPVDSIIETVVQNGRIIPVTANGYKALSIADNLLVSEYLQAGNPAFYELEGSTGTTGKPRIQMVVYYNPNNPKTKKFGQPTTNSKRIVIGQGFGKDINNLSERFAAEIAGGKERVETKVTYVNLNKSAFNAQNKEQLSIEDIEAMIPYMYVIGKSFNSNENIVLLNKEADGENFLSVSDFISDLKSKFPNDNFNKVEEELKRDQNNGKVVFVKGNTIIPLDTLTNADYTPNKEFIEKLIDSLVSDATGTASWQTDVEGDMLSEAVRKRTKVKDYTNEKSPNFRGRLIEYFASGPQHRAENPEELLYKIEYNEQEAKSEKVYLTKEQALEELLAIRVNIDHEDLRATKPSKGLTSLLADVLRIPATTLADFAPIYNVVGLESVGEAPIAPETVQVEDQPIVTPEEQETKNNAPAEASEAPETPKTRGRKGKTNTDFKISNADYVGRVEKAVSYIKTRFEEIGVEVNDDVLRNLVKGTTAEGSKVWGAFHNAMVTLSSISGEKIGKHEAMHVVFKMFLNKKQQTDILNELWSKHKNDVKYKGKEKQFTQEMQEFLTSDSFNNNKDFKVTDDVNYTLKAVDILQSDKAKQVFEKGNKNNWSLDKILTELQVPKEQKQLIVDLGISDREQLALELADRFNFNVEVNTTTKTIVPKYLTEETDEFGFSTGVTKKPLIINTDYYSNLTVPGGTNYTENEISTPLITPSIKGHARFATDKGIGWFRSDDKAGSFYEDASEIDLEGEKIKLEGGIRTTEKTDGTKTRRILEVQSDLFQKGREKKNLIKGKDTGFGYNDMGSQDEFESNGIVYGKDGKSYYKLRPYAIISEEEYNKALSNSTGLNTKENQFLQLLNKDNNWVTFFVKSIIQDSAKKGYEKVLFPSGDTASKVEGHTTLEEFKKQKEDRIKFLDGEINDPENIERRIEEAKREKEQLKQELERVEGPEGFGALKPIYNFYENTVTNILKKQGYSAKLITDEYGNTWNEVTIDADRDNSNILLKSSSEQFYFEQSILTQLQEDLSDAFEDYKNTLLLPEGFSKKYPTISKFIENLFNFLKRNYLIGRSYITNNKSINQLFYEVENNILGRDFMGRRKKSVRDTFQKALDNLEKPDFKVSDWSTAETYKFADFLSTDIFTRFLQDKYKRNNMSEVMAVNKELSPTALFNEFRTNLKDILNTYKNNIVQREKLEQDSEDYEILDGLLTDIYNQYTGKNPNTAFSFIVNKRLENRFVKGGKYDDITEEDLVAEQNDNENEVKDTSEENQLESWQTKQGKIDAKTKSSARLREFFSSFPLRTRLIKNGKSERTTITDMDLYNKLYYKGEYMHNKLLVELSDNSTYTDFITAINNLVPKHQFAGDLLGSIMNLSEEQMMEAYDNGTLELPLDILENQDAYPSYNMWILKDMYQAIADQTNLNPHKTLTTSKGKQVQTTQVVKSVKDTDYDNAVRSIKETIDNKLSNPVSRATLKDVLEQTIDAIDKKGKVAGFIIEVFSQIGYEASNELLLNLQPSASLDGKEDNLSYLKKGLVSILNDINDSKSVIDATGRGVDIPAKLLSTYSTISSGLSYMNVENENEFAHKNSNYLTRLQAIWNKGADRRKQWVDNMKMFNGQPILGHYRNPFYTDFLNESYTYKIVADGFIQVEGQSNSGKPYANYNKAEIIASSINAFLAKNNVAKEKNTIEKGHALFHTQVYSDSPQRWFLHAPVFSKSDIAKKLAQITYSEIERIFYVKQGDLSQFEKLRAAGSIFQNIPELNDITFSNNNNTTLKFIDVFNLTEWQDFNGNSIVPGLSTMTYLSKTGEKVTVEVPSSNYKNLLEVIIEQVLLDNKNNFINYLAEEGVYNMIPEVVKGDEDVTGKIKEKDLEDFYYNTYYNNIISQNVFGGDPANYKINKDSLKTDIDIVKRTKQEISPNILKVFKRPTFNVIILKDIELKTPLFKDKGGKDIKANTTDAGAYHTLARRREIMEADPNWDLIKNDVAPIFDRIQNGTYTQEDLQTLDLQPLKPFVYTQIIQNIDTKKPDGTPGTAAIRVPIQLKDSEHVLLPTEAFLVEGQERYVRPTSLDDITNGKYIRPDLAKLLYLMETQDVDLAVFESGSKAEVFNKVDIDNADENTITASKVILNNSDWGIQQEVPRKDMEAKVGQGSQEHKIMSANVDPDWSFKYDGKVYKGQEGANELLQSIQERNAEANLKKALKKITDKDGNVNIDKVLDILKEGIIEKNSNLESLEGLVRQADGKTLIPVELLGKKGQQVLNSIFKKVSTFKVKGAALVNKPGFGYMGNRNNPNTFSDDLQLITEKAEDGSIIIKHWEAVVPVYDPIIYDYIDINGNLLLDENKNPLIPEKLLQAFFYRIPTEDKYSMFPIRIKRFSMPSQGGGIILPREATETAGLDFDVDKLYGYYYNFKVKTTPAELDSFKKYVLQDTNDRDLKSKYIDAIYGGYIEDIEMLQEKGLSEDDIPFIKKYSVSLRRYEKQYKIDNPTASFNKSVDIYESSLNTAEGTQNLKLDVYFSLTQTKAYGRDALKPGNKTRLTELRNKVLANSTSPNYSYADPVHVTNNATKNIVGKRLIGIFANANSFYNLIQGVTKINLKGKLTFTVGSTIYNFTSLADVNPQISKNIAELLFASTEDVKDPVLEPLNINEITSSLLVTMLSLTADNGDKIIKFEDAIAVLSDPSIVEAVKKVQKDGGRLKDVYKGKYERLVNISDAYNNIISASKIDQELGPDFYTIQSKLASIDSIIEASTGRFYPFLTEDVIKILPTSSLNSDIKQLNVYRKALEKELAMFSSVYSFLQPTVDAILQSLGKISKNKKLRPKDMQKYSYMVYDAAIQGYLNSKNKLQDLKENFPKKLASYTFPEGSGILQQAFEIKNNVAKMRWVNISASDILTQYQNAFTDLFTSDPEFASDLATYAFLTGTNFSMDSIVKIVPNVYYNTTEGQVIRDIINGNQLSSALLNLSDPFTSVLFNNFAPILNELKEFTFKDGVYTSNTPMKDEYVYIREKTGNVLLKQTEEGDYYPVHRQEKGALPNYILNTAVEINKTGDSAEDIIDNLPDTMDDSEPDINNNNITEC